LNFVNDTMELRLQKIGGLMDYLIYNIDLAFFHHYTIVDRP
jgi:hypothetical protein